MTNKIETISVVMSVKNGEQFLEKAVESILNQTFKNFEFFIVDNHSTDQTPLILADLAKKDARIKVITRNHPGNFTDGRSAGIEAINNDWFALMDADDVALPNRLECQVEFINELLTKNTENDRLGWKIGALGTHADYCNQNERILGEMRPGATNFEEFDKNYHNNNDQVLIDPSTLIFKPAFLEVGGYRNHTDPPCDLDLWYRMAEKGYAFISMEKKLMLYRVHSGSNSVNNTLFQRYMTHYVNFNMRRRRSGLKEIDIDSFHFNVWSRWNYKLPRIYRDYYFLFYKKAANAYGENKRARLAFFLLISSMMRPWQTLVTLKRQKF